MNAICIHTVGVGMEMGMEWRCGVCGDAHDDRDDAERCCDPEHLERVDFSLEQRAEALSAELARLSKDAERRGGSLVVSRVPADSPTKYAIKFEVVYPLGTLLEHS